jgi:hypothetical protein
MDLGLAGKTIIGVCFFVLGSIICSIPVMKLIHLWMDNSIEPLLAICVIVSYFGLLSMIIVSPGFLQIILLILIVISSIALHQITSAWDQRACKKMENDQYDNYVKQLDADPQNPIAREEVAKILYKRGKKDEAIEQMEWLLATFPSLAMRYRPQIDYWKHSLNDQSVHGHIFCDKCHAENPYNASYCMECGAPFGFLSGVLNNLNEDSFLPALVKCWIIVAGFVIISILCFHFMPFILAFIAFIILAVISGISVKNILRNTVVKNDTDEKE